MKFLFLVLTIHFVTVHCMKNCYPIHASEPKPKPGFSNKPCPVRPIADSFDAKKLEGKWYVIEAFPNVYYKSFSCNFVDNVAIGPYSYNHTWCDQSDGEYSCSSMILNHKNQDGKAYFEYQNGKFLSSIKQENFTVD